MLEDGGFSLAGHFARNRVRTKLCQIRENTFIGLLMFESVGALPFDSILYLSKNMFFLL